MRMRMRMIRDPARISLCCHFRPKRQKQNCEIIISYDIAMQLTDFINLEQICRGVNSELNCRGHFYSIFYTVLYCTLCTVQYSTIIVFITLFP